MTDAERKRRQAAKTAEAQKAADERADRETKFCEVEGCHRPVNNASATKRTCYEHRNFFRKAKGSVADEHGRCAIEDCNRARNRNSRGIRMPVCSRHKIADLPEDERAAWRAANPYGSGRRKTAAA